MADKVKHWPSWANWCARDEEGFVNFFEEEPWPNEDIGDWSYYGEAADTSPNMELVEIDPATPWQESKQRRPE